MPKYYGTTENGQFEIFEYTTGCWPESVEVLATFYANESMSIGCEVNLKTQAQDELNYLCEVAAQDGVSLVAKEASTGRVAGVAFNKIQVAGVPFYDDFIKEHCVNDSSIALINGMSTVDGMFNVFEYRETNCLLEHMFLSTLIPEFANNGIGTALTKYSIQVASDVKNGLIQLPEHFGDHKPDAVVSIGTSKYTQKIFHKLGFEFHATAYHTDLFFEGKSFAERINDDTQATSQLTSIAV